MTTALVGVPYKYRKQLYDYGFGVGDIGRVLNRTANPVAPTPDGSPTVDELTIPDTPAELESMLGDSKRMQKVFGNRDAMSTFLTNYARNFISKEMEMAKQIKEQVDTELQRVVAEWAKNESGDTIYRPSLTSRDVMARGSARTNLYNPRAMGAALDRDFDSQADFFRTIWHNVNKTADIQTKLQRIRAAFSSTVPSEGGFLIPETLRAEILEVSLETAIVRPRARVIPMETLRVPFPAIDSTSNVSSVYGGIVAYWTEEGAALTASQASFGRIVLDAKKLTAYTEVPNELVSDSIGSFQAFLDQMFPEAVGFYEDDAFLNGTGVGMPLGVFKGPGVISQSAEVGQASSTIVWENLVHMYARMLPSSLSRAVWIVSPNTIPELATMALSVGTGGSAIWLTNGQADVPLTILGRPVLISEKVPPLGSAGDVNFVDFGFYLIGDRQVMSAMSSPHYKFQNDQTAYRIIERVDGRPWLQSAITPRNNGDTLSPYVSLAARP
jgi:HK97 family phage major capsid protein